MKRMFLTILIVGMLLTQITACSREAANNEEWTNGKKPEKVTLNIFMPPHFPQYVSVYGSTLLDEVLKELNRKAEQKLNVNIEITNLRVVQKEDGGWVAEVDPDTWYALNGNVCDMLFINENSKSFFDLKTLYESGFIKDITELFAGNAPNYFRLFAREELDTVSFNGKILAVPSYNLPDTRRLHAIIREDLLEEFRIKNISSYEEFENFLELVKKNKPELIPTRLTPFYSKTPSILEMFAEAGGYAIAVNNQIELVYRPDDPAIKLMDWKQTPEYRNALETLRRWRSRGFISNQGVKLREYASIIGYKGDGEKISEQIRQESGVQVKFAEFDLYPESITQRTFDPGNIVIFNSHSNNTERALAFLDWLMTDKEAYRLFMYGIKGKDYKLDKKDRVKLIAREGYDESCIYNVIHRSWFIVNNNLDFQDKDQLKARIQYIESRSKYFPHTGFTIDIVKIRERFPEFDFNSRSRFESSVLNGELTPGEIDDFLSAQKKITDPMVEEIQTQLDEWMAGKEK